MHYFQHIILALMFFTSSMMCAQINNDVYQCWKNKDIEGLVSLYGNHPQLRSSIQDVLAMLADADYSSLSYEDLISIKNHYKNDSIMSQFFNPMLAEREYEIITELCSMNPQDFNTYIEEHPQRKALLYDALGTSIVAQKHNLSVQELLYIQYSLPLLEPTIIEKEISERGTEIQKIIREHLEDYVRLEHEQSKLFFYVLERKVYTYVCLKYEQVCYQYATISDVPNTTDAIETQFQSIFQQCFQSKELQEYLQLEANAYCEHINSARNKYCKSAGINKYLPLQLSVPEIQFAFFSDRDIISKIPQAREDYKENRETVNSVSSVAGFLFGGLTKIIAKGIGDYLVGDNLTDKIINARLQYVDEAFISMQNDVIESTANIKENLNEQFITNENKFKAKINRQ